MQTAKFICGCGDGFCYGFTTALQVGDFLCQSQHVGHLPVLVVCHDGSFWRWVWFMNPHPSAGFDVSVWPSQFLQSGTPQTNRPVWSHSCVACSPHTRHFTAACWVHTLPSQVALHGPRHAISKVQLPMRLCCRWGGDAHQRAAHPACAYGF